MASPSAKRRRLDLLGEGARRSPRLQEKVTGAPRRSGHFSPKKLFSSQVVQQKESISSGTFYNTISPLKDDSTAGNQGGKGRNAPKGKKTKNKSHSSGPRLGGRGIPVGKISKAWKSQQRSQAKESKAAMHTKKSVKLSPTQMPVLQEIRLGRLSMSNNTSPASETAGPKKFFKTRERRETVVMKTGFDIKFKCDSVASEKNVKKETGVKRKRPLPILGGKTLTSTRKARLNGSKKITKENDPNIFVIDALDDSNRDILSVTEPSIKPVVRRATKIPSTREEEMLASWGFEAPLEMPSESKVNSRSSAVREIEKRIVLSPQDLLLTPLEECSQPSSAKDSESTGNFANDLDGKPKLFPIFTPSAKWDSEKLNGTPTSSPGVDNKRRKLRGNKEGKEQYMLDAGQKLTGLIQCTTCGMNYNGDDESDEDVHEKFHNNILKILSFQGWKCEHVVREYNDGSRVIMVYADNKKQMQKVEKIRDIVDMELGFVQTNKSIKPNCKIFLYVSPKKEIAGYCLAEPIEKAYKLLTDSPRKNSRSSPRKKPLRCSEVANPVRCGINRIWVFHNYRHQGIATKLLDSVRFNFLNGYPLTSEELAYTDPTPDGSALFSKYNGHSQYMVYN